MGRGLAPRSLPRWLHESESWTIQRRTECGHEFGCVARHFDVDRIGVVGRRYSLSSPGSTCHTPSPSSPVEQRPDYMDVRLWLEVKPRGSVDTVGINITVGAGSVVPDTRCRGTRGIFPATGRGATGNAPAPVLDHTAYAMRPDRCGHPNDSQPSRAWPSD